VISPQGVWVRKQWLYARPASTLHGFREKIKRKGTNGENKTNGEDMERKIYMLQKIKQHAKYFEVLKRLSIMRAGADMCP